MLYPVLSVQFTDNNGKRAQVSMKLGAGADYPGALAFALATVPALAAISDAAVIGFTLTWGEDFEAPSSAGPLSNVEVPTYLFYTSGPDTASVYVPSVAGVSFETVGPYAGIRLTRDSASLSGVLSSLDGLLTGTLDPVGRPYGTTFVVGARGKPL